MGKCVAVCSSVMQCVAMWYKLWHVSLWNRGSWISQIRICERNVLQCVCSVLKSVAEFCRVWLHQIWICNHNA